MRWELNDSPKAGTQHCAQRATKLQRVFTFSTPLLIFMGGRNQERLTKYIRARTKFREDATRGECLIAGGDFRARACISPESSKIDNSQSSLHANCYKHQANDLKRVMQVNLLFIYKPNIVLLY